MPSINLESPKQTPAASQYSLNFRESEVKQSKCHREREREPAIVSYQPSLPLWLRDLQTVLQALFGLLGLYQVGKESY